MLSPILNRAAQLTLITWCSCHSEPSASLVSSPSSGNDVAWQFGPGIKILPLPREWDKQCLQDRSQINHAEILQWSDPNETVVRKRALSRSLFIPGRVIESRWSLLGSPCSSELHF